MQLKNEDTGTKQVCLFLKQGLIVGIILGCKNLARFSLFFEVLFCSTLLFIMFCFLCFTLLVSFTGFDTEDEPIVEQLH